MYFFAKCSSLLFIYKSIKKKSKRSSKFAYLEKIR